MYEFVVYLFMFSHADWLIMKILSFWVDMSYFWTKTLFDSLKLYLKESSNEG